MEEINKKISYSSYYAVISSTIYQEPSFLDYRFIAAKAAKELGFTVNLNSEDSGSTQEEFDDCMNTKSPVFILILGEKLTDNVKTECEKALELGLTIMPFLKTDKREKIPEKTKCNMNYISEYLYCKNCCSFSTCEELYNHVLKRLKEFIASSLSNTIHYLKSRADIYPNTGKIICSAKCKVILCQNTSSLILGYRNNSLEEQWYTKVIKWLKTQNNRISFIHIFSELETSKALKSSEYTAIENARKNLEELISIKDGPHIYFRKSSSIITPCVVVDNNFSISLTLGASIHYLEVPSRFIKTEDAKSITNILEQEGNAWTSSSDLDSLQKIDDFYKGKR